MGVPLNLNFTDPCTARNALMALKGSPEILPSSGQTKNLTVVFMWSIFEATFLSRNFVTKNKKNPLFSHENSGFLVRVAGFEPTASWTRTKRDTKLRHTRI